LNRDIKQFSQALVAESGRTMYGVEEVIRLSLVALFTGGHVLLEGNPGLGKTELVKTLARVLKLPFGRIQFTPDLMPADITGTFMPDLEDRQKLAFRPGPIFTSLLLADEINRATPKTQSAMLEAMAEGQVTVLGQRYKLQRPFMVLATQNPIDHEGTYALPEAQADRFMFKVEMPIPQRDTLLRILEKCAGQIAGVQTGPNIDPNAAHYLPKDRADAVAKFEELQKRIQQVKPLPSLEVHIINLFLASNGRFSELQGLDKGQVDALKILISEVVRYGLGPRAVVTLSLGSKAYSLLFTPDAELAEAPALARVLLPALRHRIKLEFDWTDRFRRRFDIREENESALMDQMLKKFVLSAAPKANAYFETFAGVFDKTLQDVRRARSEVVL